MNKENMLKWAEALESDRYEQCRGSWGRGNTAGHDRAEGFCCLHVALDIFGKQGAIYPDEDGSISIILQSLYGFGQDEFEKFVNMNDKQMLTFPEIAQVIRKMVEND